MAFFIALFALCVPASLSAQLRDVRVGEQVRAFNDSARTVLSGRVVIVHRDHVGIERSPGATPTRIPWYEVHRLEAFRDGAWQEAGFAAVDAEVDTAWIQGVAAGAAAAERVVVDYFVVTTLLAVPAGYMGFCLFSDCDLKYKAVPAAAIVALVLTGSVARKRVDRLVADLERYDFPEKPSAYTEGYRQEYERKLRSRVNKQILGGVLVGTVGGFGLLVYVLSGMT